MKEIPVIYQNGMMDLVEAKLLQELIEQAQVIKFQRSDGWVTPDIGPVRRLNQENYQGQERRIIGKIY